jgi:aminoglycoside 3'-phosphotransferase-2
MKRLNSSIQQGDVQSPDQPRRTQITVGKSAAEVFRVKDEWIEKFASPEELGLEVRALQWCAASLLPVPRVVDLTEGCLKMSLIPGVDLSEVSSASVAAAVLLEALRMIHSVPWEECPLDASWATRLKQAEEHVIRGEVDASDFDEVNLGRSPEDILSELQAMPSLPELRCFTHGDACLPNFLTDGFKLTGIVDWGRAGVTHPAQDWALALRSMKDNFGEEGERLLRVHLPAECADEELLRRFRLLDELF